MNTQNIFRSLTCGVKFSNKNRRSNLKKSFVLKKEQILELDIKEEPQEQSSDSDYYAENHELDESIGETTLIDAGAVKCGGSKKKKKEMTAKKQKMLASEKINELRNKHHIRVKGSNPPPPIESFDELAQDYGVMENVVKGVLGCGYTAPTPIQMQAIPAMLKNRTILACAPTGSGKTAAFLIPIVNDLKAPQNSGFRALILCPTRELAKQTQRECHRYTDELGLKIHTINKVNQAEALYGANSKHNFDILITTPQRICYLLDQEKSLIDLSKVGWLILDEADKLFEDGKNSFKDQFTQIYEACSCESKRVALFSATWTKTVAEWGRRHLSDLLTISIGQRNSATDLIDQKLVFVGSESGKLMAFRDIVRDGLQPPVLVFVQSKERARQLFNELLYDGINIDIISADRTQEERDNVIKSFREGKTWVLICTELMSRGIDFKGVNLVVNYDFPLSSIAYIHRIGRTGRAGRPGKAVTFFTQDDTANLRKIAHIMRNSGCDVPQYMLTLKKHNKKETKKLLKTTPSRDDITTAPKFVLEKRLAKKRKNTENGSGKFVKNARA